MTTTQRFLCCFVIRRIEHASESTVDSADSAYSSANLTATPAPVRVWPTRAAACGMSLSCALTGEKEVVYYLNMYSRKRPGHAQTRG